MDTRVIRQGGRIDVSFEISLSPGYIDADELEAVAAAVGTMAPSAHDAAGEGDATVDLHEFYVTLLGQAPAFSDKAHQPSTLPDES